MCYEFDARPPELPADLVAPRVAGGAAAETLKLRSAEGNTCAAALAASPGATDPAVIILPDVRGLYRFYVELAERFSAAGRHAIAIDYFGRTAGAEPRGEDFDWMAHLPETSPARVQEDIAAARDAISERTGASMFVTVGFCFGGAQSYLAATQPELGIDAAVAFYGTLQPSRIGFPFAMPDPLAHVAETCRPVLGLFGGGDPLIPPDDIAAFDRGLTDAGVEHELISYPGAPHSFFDRSSDEHAAACEDAWRRVLGFLDLVGTTAVTV
jgi:carboxymethylenebutenolidase